MGADPENYRKLSINAMIGLFCIDDHFLYKVRTSSRKEDGIGSYCTRTTEMEEGQYIYDFVYRTRIISNCSYRPIHDQIMAMEQTHLARLVYCIKELKIPQRCIKQVKTDCLLLQNYPRSKEKHLLQLADLTYAHIGSIRNKGQNQRLIDDNGVKISCLTDDHQKIYRCQTTDWQLLEPILLEEH